MIASKYGRYDVLEYDAGAKVLSRDIEIPYPAVGAGIAVSEANILYVNSGTYKSGGGFGIDAYLPKPTKAFTSFVVGFGYSGGGLQVAQGHFFVGDAVDNAVQRATLPAKKHPLIRPFRTESSGDYLAVDTVSQYLYAISKFSNTLQSYDLHTGRLLSVLSGFGRGVAADSR